MAHIMSHHGETHRAVYTNRDEDYDDTSARVAAVDTDRQHAAYGGMHFGAALYGWLVSTGIAAIVTSILAAAGSAVAVSNTTNAAGVSADTAKTVGIASGILLLIVLALAYYAGGYVAGRLSRFDGARQGLATWIIGLIVTLILGGAGAALGAKYNVLQQLNLPHLPIGSNFTTGGLVATVLALLVTLGAAILGGKFGERYHRRIDAEGTVANNVRVS